MANPRIPARRGHKHKLFRDFDSLRLDDNQALQFGDDADATLYFDGTSLIINGPAKFLDDQTLTFGTDDDAVIHWDSSEGELDISLTGGRIDLNADIRFTTAKGINAETASGLCNLDLDSLVNDNSDSYIRVNRSTTTTGSAYMQWFKGDGSAGVGMEFEHDNSTDSSYLSLKGDGDVVLTLAADENNSGEDNNPYIRFDQDGGSVGSVIGHAGTGAVRPDGSTTFTGGGSNFLTIATDGDAADIALGSGDSATLKVMNDTNGKKIRIFNDAADEYTDISAGDSVGHLISASTARANIYFETQLLADDATGTWDWPAGNGGIALIIGATTTSVAVNNSAIVFQQGTSTMTSIYDNGVSTAIAAANPDTDTVTNIYCASATSLGIKNREGSSRYYTVYMLTGDV